MRPVEVARGCTRAARDPSAQGIQAISAPGHTLGHTIYMITSGGQYLAAIGDIRTIRLGVPCSNLCSRCTSRAAARVFGRVRGARAAWTVHLVSEANDPNPGGVCGHVAKHPDGQLASFHLKRPLNGANGTRITMD